MKLKLWLTYVLVIGAALVVAAAVFGYLLWRNPPQDRRELQRIRIVSDMVRLDGLGYKLTPPYDAPAIKDALKAIDEGTQVRIAIFDQTGSLLADSRWDSASPLPTWAYFASRDPNARPLYVDPAGRDWLISYVPFNGGYIMFFAVPRPSIGFADILREQSMSLYLRAALLAFFVVSIIAIWISRWRAAQRIDPRSKTASPDPIMTKNTRI